MYSKKVEDARNADPERILSQLGIKFGKSYGRWIRCRCPFHGSADDDFYVDKEYKRYKCHSPKCEASAGMDGIGLIMKLLNKSFQEAVDFITGNTSEAYTPIKVEKIVVSDEAKVRWLKTVSLIARNNVAQAIDYWSKRGLSERTILDFKLGAWMAKEVNSEDPEHCRLRHQKQFIPWTTAGNIVSACARRDDFWCRRFIEENPEVKMRAIGKDELKSLFGPKFTTIGGANKSRVFNNRRVIDVKDGVWTNIERDIIFAAEGVGDVMAIEDAGFPAVGGKGSPNFGKAIAGCKRLIIIRDNDEAGLVYANEMTAMAEQVGVRSEIWTPEEKDPLDMLKSGKLKGWIESNVHKK